MAGYRLVDTIPAPFTTLGGKTKGPAVSLGRHRGRPGAPLWLHESELRGVVKAAGWPSPEKLEETEAALAAAVDRADVAEARVAELEAENATLRGALTALKTKPAAETA